MLSEGPLRLLQGMLRNKTVVALSGAISSEQMVNATPGIPNTYCDVQ
jgi:hypothetical protein